MLVSRNKNFINKLNKHQRFGKLQKNNKNFIKPYLIRRQKQRNLIKKIYIQRLLRRLRPYSTMFYRTTFFLKFRYLSYFYTKFLISKIKNHTLKLSSRRKPRLLKFFLYLCNKHYQKISLRLLKKRKITKRILPSLKNINVFLLNRIKFPKLKYKLASRFYSKKVGFNVLKFYLLSTFYKKLVNLFSYYRFRRLILGRLRVQNKKLLYAWSLRKRPLYYSYPEYEGVISNLFHNNWSSYWSKYTFPVNKGLMLSRTMQSYYKGRDVLFYTRKFNNSIFWTRKEYSLIITNSRNNYFLTLVDTNLGEVKLVLTSGKFKYVNTQEKRAVTTFSLLLIKLCVYLEKNSIKYLEYVKIIVNFNINKLRLNKAHLTAISKRFFDYEIKTNKILVVLKRPHGLGIRKPKPRRK